MTPSWFRSSVGFSKNFHWFRIILVWRAHWGILFSVFQWCATKALFLGLELMLQRSLLGCQTSCFSTRSLLNNRPSNGFLNYWNDLKWVNMASGTTCHNSMILTNFGAVWITIQNEFQMSSANKASLFRSGLFMRKLSWTMWNWQMSCSRFLTRSCV